MENYIKKAGLKKIIILALILFSTFVVYSYFLESPPSSVFSSLIKARRLLLNRDLITENPPAKLNPTELKVPILLYHYIEDNSDERDFLRTSMATRPYFFEIQMRYLSTSGYTTISPSTLKTAFEDNIPIPEKPIILTFDDGFRDYYYNAYPILKRYNLHAVVYVIVNHIGRSGNLTSEMIDEMIDSGVFELGSHTNNHVWLSQVSADEARREIFESKKILSEIFNYDVKHFSYPGGFEASWVVDLVREAGYETAVTTKAGVVQTPDKILSLKRIRVGNLGETEFAALIEGRRTSE